MKLLNRRRLVPVLVAALLVVTTASGLAIASQQDTKAAKRACASLYAQDSSAYTDCLAYKAGLVAGDSAAQAAPAAAPSALRPPVRYCWQDNHYVNEKLKAPKRCTKPITCLVDASLGKYRCADAHGRPVDPPDPTCQIEPQNYVCDTDTATLGRSTPGEAPIQTMLGEPTSVTSPAQAPTLAVRKIPSYNPPSPDEPLTTPSPTPPVSTTPSPTTSPSGTTTRAPSGTVAQAVREADARDLDIWLDTNLIPAWRVGEEHLRVSVERLAAYARLSPKVIGVKISYELGTRGELTTPGEIARFVTEVSAALREVLPRGRQIGVDVAIPGLGCGSHQICKEAMRSRYPALTLSHVEHYVLSGAIDAVWISHLPEADASYGTWGISVTQAWRTHWIALKERAWETKGIFIGARELGLAHHGNQSTVTAVTAKKAVHDLVDMPLQRGAQGVALWTWRQTFDQQTWRLADAGLMSNSMWNALKATPERRSRLSIVYNPAKQGQERDIASDIQVISSLAGGIQLFAP